MDIYRQGDVLIVRVENQKGGDLLPQPQGQGPVLALGELTGHAHRIESPTAKLWSLADTRDRLLELVEDTRLVHEEHKAVFLRAGQYRVRIQSQWLGEEVTNVAD